MMQSQAPSYHNVAVAAPVRVPYRLHSRHDVHWWLGAVLAQMFETYSLTKNDIDGLSVASYGLAPDNAAALTEYFDLPVRWLQQLPFGGASGAIAVRHAARAVEAGDVDLVVCMAADRMASGDFASLIENFTGFARDYVNPYGQTGPNGPFSLITDAFLRRYSLDRSDLGRLVVAQRRNGADNPEALQQNAIDLSDYMQARQIAGPVHLYDCVRPCCGGEGFIVTRTEIAERLNLPYAQLSTSMERHSADRQAAMQTAIGWAQDRDAMFDIAGIGPEDVDLLEAYDDYPVIVAMQLLEWGFATPETLGAYLRETDFSAAGDGLPLNTGGGQLAIGQAGAAGGYIAVVDAVRQLIGKPSGKAVRRPHTAIVSGYGTVNYDRGLCCSGLILQAAGT